MKNERMARIVGGIVGSSIIVRFLNTLHHTIYVEHYSVLNATYGQIQSRANGDMIFNVLQGVAVIGIMSFALMFKRKK